MTMDISSNVGGTAQRHRAKFPFAARNRCPLSPNILPLCRLVTRSGIIAHFSKAIFLGPHPRGLHRSPSYSDGTLSNWLWSSLTAAEAVDILTSAAVE